MSFREALRFWLRLGFVNFGGPAGQIAIMHREIVERRRWIPEDQFLRALNFCMILPGPEAQQLAVYIGWLLHGTTGGIAAGVLFVAPSIFVLLALSWMVAAHAGVPAVAGLLYGVQPVVIAIVAEAVLRIGRRTLRHPVLYLFAAAAFVAIAVFSVPFPLIVAAAAAGGVLLERALPEAVRPRGAGTPDPGPPSAGAIPAGPRDRPVLSGSSYPPAGRAVRIVLLFTVLWAVPVGVLRLWRGSGDVLVREALFFTRAAFITFGGAYAVLSYIAHVAVNVYGWLTAGQMIQGLALAESTPGPLIMVTQYVGFIGAWNQAHGLPPLAGGVLGALITTYVTFLFCFMFIFVGAPYVEALAGNQRLQAALVGVTSAVVGVILNLATFFGARVLWPGAQGPDLFALVLSLISFAVLLRLRIPIQYLVILGALIGMAWTLLGWRGI